MPPRHIPVNTRTTPANHGSATQLETTTPLPHLAPTLRLRAETTDGRRIHWAEDVVDNEGMGKKKSKVCCIYHAPRAVGESSSENDSSSSSGSDPDGGKDNDDDDDGRARMSGSRKSRRKRKGEHDHRHDHEGACGGGESSHSGKPAPARRKGRGNAYETQPKVRAEEGRAKA